MALQLMPENPAHTGCSQTRAEPSGFFKCLPVAPWAKEGPPKGGRAPNKILNHACEATGGAPPNR